jgi:NTP pyrophosphatase (non-canonical NTP hydrolase)
MNPNQTSDSQTPTVTQSAPDPFANSPMTRIVGLRRIRNWDEVLEEMIGLVTAVNAANGWYDSSRTFGEDIALLHSEVSEAFEAMRKDDWSGNKDSVQDELADVFIRLLDTCARHNVQLANQFLKKMAINETRGYRHGGKLI